MWIPTEHLSGEQHWLQGASSEMEIYYHVSLIMMIIIRANSLQEMEIYHYYVCLVFLHCVFSNDDYYQGKFLLKIEIYHASCLFGFSSLCVFIWGSWWLLSGQIQKWRFIIMFVWSFFSVCLQMMIMMIIVRGKFSILINGDLLSCLFGFSSLCVFKWWSWCIRANSL